MQEKVCTLCNCLKPFAEFHKAKLGKFGLKAICKTCNLFEFKRYREANPEKRAKTQKNWEISNAEKIKEKRDAKAEENRLRALKWAEDNRQKARQKTRDWVKNNPEKHRRNCIARQYVKAKQTPSWADFSKMRLVYFEAKFLTEKTGIPHEVDHIIPLRGKLVCGLHCEANLQVIPRSANRSKSNRFTLEGTN